MEESAHRRRALIIFNPVAGRRRVGIFRRTLAELQQRGCEATVKETTRPREAEDFAREAADEYDLVVAAGGDGTVNEVVNGLAGGTTPLGLLPLGTSNVLAREIGLGRDPAAVADVLVSGAVRRVNLGRANDRLFAVMASVGFDSRVVDAVSLPAKRILGRWAYVTEAVRQLSLGPPPRIAVSVDGQYFETAGAVIANGRLYGGPFVTAPEARLEERLFQAVLFQPGGRLLVVRLAAALVTNRLSRSSRVAVVPARSVVIDGPAGEPVQGDGDVLTRLPASISIADDPLSLVAP